MMDGAVKSGGRRRLPESGRRSAEIRIYLRPAERDAVEVKARAAGMTPSQYLAGIALREAKGGGDGD